MLTLNLNGITDLPPGKLADIVTYLEMRQPPVRENSNNPKDLTLLRVHCVALDWYRNLFRRIGQDWLWFSRLQLSDQELGAILSSAQIEIYALKSGSEDVGLVELDLRYPPDIELAFFGLVPDAVGKGAGRFLMDETIKLAFSRAPRRLWVHTCTLDHPQALAFYMRSGFVPYRRAIEVIDDPRLAGVLPQDAGPHAPII